MRTPNIIHNKRGAHVVHHINSKQVLQWNRQSETIEQHKKMLEEFLSNYKLDRDLSKFKERGIVTVAGGQKYFPCGYVLCYILRKLGCPLPIEVWYLGEKELSQQQIKLFQDLDKVTCIDATKISSIPQGIGGWELKPFAISESCFAEVLFLDADQVPVKDPNYLFYTEQYLDSGAVFWHDLPNRFGLDIKKEAFEVIGLPVPGNIREPSLGRPSDYEPFESGQILINKRKEDQWKALSLCKHFNEHSNFWYPQPKNSNFWYFYGDKSTFYFAWHKTKTPFAMPRNPDWIGNGQGGSFLHYDFEGNIVFQHRCQPRSKLSVVGKNVKLPNFQHHELMEEALSVLRGPMGRDKRSATHITNRRLLPPTNINLPEIRNQEQTKVYKTPITPQEQEAYIEAFKQAAEANYVYPEHKYEDKGIIICGGGKYLLCAHTAILALRRAGCGLPIELWQTKEEKNYELNYIMEPFDGVTVRCVDEIQDDSFPNFDPKGWQLKPYSIIHSSFEEVIFVDSDNIVARDPTFLLYEKEYQKLGAIFWPDLHSGYVWVPDVVWQMAGIDEQYWKTQKTPALESGQLVINKRKCWKELQLTMHLNANSNLWYRVVYGDKDTFLLAWCKCKTKFFLAPLPGWVKPTMLQKDLEGNVLFYHNCQGKNEIDQGKRLRAWPTDIFNIVQEAYEMRKQSRETLRTVHKMARVAVPKVYVPTVVQEPIIEKTPRQLFEEECQKIAGGFKLSDNQTILKICGGPVLYCRTDEDNFTGNLIKDGFWEAWITLFFKKLVQPGWNCVDVGCNAGYYTVLFKHWGANKVTAIDLNQKGCELLCKSIKDNGFENVRVMQGAVWSKDYEEFEVGTYGDKNTLNTKVLETEADGVVIGPYGMEIHFIKAGRVKTITLDTLLEKEERIDLIKIDVEGAECHVWQGMQKIIERFDPRILMEVAVWRKYTSTFFNEIAAKYKLRMVNYDGVLENITMDQLLARVDEDTMLYLSHKD